MLFELEDSLVYTRHGKRPRIRLARPHGARLLARLTPCQVSGYPGATHQSFPDFEAAKVGRAGPRIGRLLTLFRILQGWAKILHPSPLIEGVTNARIDLFITVEVGKDEQQSKAKRSEPSIDNTGKTHPPQMLRIEPPKPTDPPLSTQQSMVLDRILKGENFFFTGSAGTGKSVLLRAIIKAFGEKAAAAQKELYQKRGSEDAGYLEGQPIVGRLDASGVQRWKYGVTASTGMAAM